MDGRPGETGWALGDRAAAFFVCQGIDGVPHEETDVPHVARIRDHPYGFFMLRAAGVPCI